MRAASALAAVALTTTFAHAQPVTRPSEIPCRARVIDAPEPVRAEIERWVRLEPRCEHELDVRVTRVAGGLHLVATDNEGRVRERVIPDAQSAAVLVVSWMADDAIDDTPPPMPPGQLAPMPEAPRVPTHRLELGRDEPAIRVRAPVAPRRHRWLGLGASGGDESFGVHAQLDLLGIGAWTLGIAGGWQTGEHDLDMHDADVTVGDATVFAAYTRPFGRVDVRTQLGIGAALEGTGSRMDDDISVLPKVQAGAFLRVHVGDDWGLLGGPLVDVTPHSLGVSAFVGLERRL